MISDLVAMPLLVTLALPRRPVLVVVRRTRTSPHNLRELHGLAYGIQCLCRISVGDLRATLIRPVDDNVKGSILVNIPRRNNMACFCGGGASESVTSSREL